jgi:hypothetical protein
LTVLKRNSLARHISRLRISHTGSKKASYRDLVRTTGIPLSVLHAIAQSKIAPDGTLEFHEVKPGYRQKLKDSTRREFPFCFEDAKLKIRICELAKRWHLSANTLRRLVAGEPGVIRITVGPLLRSREISQLMLGSVSDHAVNAAHCLP